LHSAAGEEDRIRLVIEKKARRLPLQEKKEKDRIIQSLLRLGYSYDEISYVLSEYTAAGEEDV
jgi:SOS response regulatory protein OraA/RecX